MMESNSRVFNVEQVDYEGILREEKPFADNLTAWFKCIGTKHVLDIGCGPGVYVESLNSAGIKSTGYDADPRVVNYPNCKLVSMFDVTETSECVLCIEVAEHIHESNNEDIVDALVRMVKPGGKLVFSAAQPGQGGEGHINCKAPLYWIDKFLSRGMGIDHHETSAMKLFLMRNGGIFGWFMNNANVFKKPRT